MAVCDNCGGRTMSLPISYEDAVVAVDCDGEVVEVARDRVKFCTASCDIAYWQDAGWAILREREESR